MYYLSYLLYNLINVNLSSMSKTIPFVCRQLNSSKKFGNSSLIDYISLIITFSLLQLVSLKSLFNSLSIDTIFVMVMKSWRAHYGWF